MTSSNSNILDLSDGEQMGVTTGLQEVPLTSTEHVNGCEEYDILTLKSEYLTKKTVKEESGKEESVKEERILYIRIYM